MEKIKIEKEPAFTPFYIRVDTKRESDFLNGLLLGSEDTKKKDCKNYDPVLDEDFFETLNKAI